jgi:outer membrane lipoprotein-sorting protein
MKRFIFFSVLIAVTIFFAQMAPAQDLTSLKEMSRNIRSVKAEFLQKRSLPILTKPLFSEGKLFFSMPDWLRWEYFTPLRSVMLRKGNNIQIYNFSGGVWKPEMAQAVESRRMVFSEISHWFQGRFDESKAFKHFYSPGPPERVILISREGINRFINRIEIILSVRPGVIDRVEIEEPGASSTSIEFKNVEINSSLSPEVFEKP